MEQTHEVPFIRLEGSPHERGLAHGRAAAERIAKNVDFYKKLLKLDDEVLRARSHHFADRIKSFRPAFVEEMDGIAEGAGVEAVYIYMINARTELLSLSDEVHSECATFYFSPTSLLFENWDWSESSKDLTVLLSIALPEGRTVLTFTEAGMLGKVGMSSAGFGVAFNYLYPNGVLDGVPIHAVLRAILESASFEEASVLLSTTDLKGTSGNILLADARGHANDYELSGTSTSVVPLSGDSLVHTNHYLGGVANDPEAGEGFLHNSFERYARAQHIIAHSQEYDRDVAQQLLLDRGEGEGMLCRDFIPEELGSTPTGTIASLIMDLPAKTIYIALNPQSADSEFTHYSL